MILGGPESANYPTSTSPPAPTSIVIGEGEVTLTSCCPRCPSQGAARAARRARHRLPRRAPGTVVRTPERRKIADLDALPCRTARPSIIRSIVDVWRRHHGAEQRQPDHRARLPLQVQLVLARRVRLLAPPAQPRDGRRRSGVDRRRATTRPALVRRRCLHHQPPLAARVRGRAATGAACTCPSRPSPAPTACRTRTPSQALRGAGLLPHLDRLRERQPEHPGRHAARRDASSRCAAPWNSRSATASRSACS